MTSTARSVQAMAFVALLAGQVALAQQSSQFKANVKMTNGSDGTTATGTMYLGSAKTRTELSMDGQNIVVIADPASRTQMVLMPSDKVYMQMPIGMGPVSIPVAGPTDPTNPCSGGSGNTDCVKGPSESVNGYQAVRWDYTSADGTRTRAWVSTKLRFPIKTSDDNGSSMEFSNIAEGPQPASLFAIPAGYTKMDVAAMGAMGAAQAGRPGARGNAGNPMAGMPNIPANLPPGAAAAMAAAMRGDAPKGAAGATGSAWERGNGWILSATVTATERVTSNAPLYGSVPSEGQSTFSITSKISLPLNSGAPAAGVPGAPGPMWSHLAGVPGIGTPAGDKVPITASTTTESRSTATWKGDCTVLDPGTRSTQMKGAGENSVPITQMRPELIGQAMFKISNDLKSYDLLLGINGPKVKEVMQIHQETGAGCRGGKVSVSDSTVTRERVYGFPTTELKGMPLPATVSTITGSKKVRLRFGDRQGEMDATVTWTLTPIR